MLTYSFPTFPIIETERLVLRETVADDIPEIFELKTNSDIMKNIDKEKLKSIQEAEDTLKRIQDGYANCTGVSWAISLKGNNKMIGSCGLWRIEREHYRAELGYALMPEHWNKGIISEAIKHILDFGFAHLNVHTVMAQLNPGNARSARVLEKAGFVKEAYFKENYYFNGEFLDTLVYGKVKPK